MQQLQIPRSVRFLRLSNNRLQSLTEDPLKDCLSLISFDLSYNQLQKIENLFYLTSLQILNLSHNSITVVENLEGNTNLRQLNLSDNAIHSIFIRSPLPSLAVLDLSGNKLRRLMCPNAFPCLSTLRIDRCGLTSLTDCQKFLNLRKISASRNQIVNFAPFYLPLLSHIDIDHNKMNSLSGFAQFQSLIRIDISGNPVNDEGFGFSANFPELKEFRADGSNISDPSLIAAVAPNVVLISLTFSKVSSIENLQLLVSNAKSLTSLDVRGNPINANLYPDIDNLAFGDSLPEYHSEESYGLEFPKAARNRSKYRDAVIRSSGSSLVWLDGLKIPGRGPQPPIPPSKMNFQLQDDSQVAISPPSDLSELQPAEEEVSSAEEEVCRSGSSVSDDQLSDAKSRDSRVELRHYVALTDDESDGIEILPRRQDGSVVSSDSGPANVDFNRLGIPRSDSAGSFDRFSAATDAGSELFHVLDSPHFGGGEKAGCGGVVRPFWVDLHRQEIVRRKPPEPPMKPVIARAAVPQSVGGGRWPFNARSERKLPWDKEAPKIDEPEWRKPPRRPNKPRRR
jgi:hypothetical protein